jgi:hypothetical protein
VQATVPSDVRVRWTASVPFFVIGGVGIVAGGIAAAVAGPTDWGHGSWCAAFLVLVVGVAQIGLGAGQAAVAPNVPSGRLIAGECVLWNVGSAGVIIGTLLDSPATVSVGSLVFLVALVLAAVAVRGHSGLTGRARLLLVAFRVLLVILVLSTPIGMVLSWTRA